MLATFCTRLCIFACLLKGTFCSLFDKFSRRNTKVFYDDVARRLVFCFATTADNSYYALALDKNTVLNGQSNNEHWLEASSPNSGECSVSHSFDWEGLKQHVGCEAFAYTSFGFKGNISTARSTRIGCNFAARTFSAVILSCIGNELTGAAASASIETCMSILPRWTRLTRSTSFLRTAAFRAFLAHGRF